MRNLVGGVMTPPDERQVLGLTAYYSGAGEKTPLGALPRGVLFCFYPPGLLGYQESILRNSSM